MSERQAVITTLILKGSEFIWIRELVRVAVQLYNGHFSGHGPVDVQNGKSTVSVEASSELFKGGRLRAVILKDARFGYHVTVVEPNPDKKATRVQIYVKKGMPRRDMPTVKYWQHVFHMLYNPKDGSYAFILMVDDEHPTKPVK
jgi:hypothetical protein